MFPSAWNDWWKETSRKAGSRGLTFRAELKLLGRGRFYFCWSTCHGDDVCVRYFTPPAPAKQVDAQGDELTSVLPVEIFLRFPLLNFLSYVVFSYFYPFFYFPNCCLDIITSLSYNHYFFSIFPPLLAAGVLYSLLQCFLLRVSVRSISLAFAGCS